MTSPCLMTENSPPDRRSASRDIADTLAALDVAEQAAVLAEAMSRLMARARMDDINVALFVEAVCAVVPERVRALRREEDGG